MKRILISFMVILTLINSVIAQVFPLGPKSDWEIAFFDWIRYILVNIFGLPPEWTAFPEFLYYFLLPLLGIMIIVYGFLDGMRIFDNERLNIALAIIIGFSALVSKIFIGFVKIVFGLLGPISVGAFALLFLGGLGFISKMKKAEWGTKAGVASTYEQEVNQLKGELGKRRKEYSKLLTKISRETNIARRKNLESMAGKQKKRIDSIQQRLEELKELMESP